MNHPNRKIDKWILNNINRHLCGCNCGEFIKIERRYYNIGIPKYISGHGKLNRNINMWIEENTNKYLCFCGCNQFIKVIRNHFWSGIPEYISGHNPTHTIEITKKRVESLRKYWQENDYPESAKEKISLKNSGNNNASKRLDVRKKMSDSRKKYFENGGLVWNDGLTKDDNISVLKISQSKLKDKNPNWKGGISEQPYCEKWTEKLRERIRNEYNRKCYNCGKDEKDNITKTNNVRKLSVHHLDMDKSQGCNGRKWKLVPLCMKCHSKLHRGKGLIING